MRISDLSRETRLPVATIRFYLREGLLPPGRTVGRNQVSYGQTHVTRLHLIRALTGIGHLDLASVRFLLAAIDDDDLPLPDLYGLVHAVHAMPDSPGPNEEESVEQARSDVDAFIAERGWGVDPAAPARAHATLAIAALRRLGCDNSMEFFAVYADVAEQIARLELDLLASERPDRGAAVARSVLLDVLLAIMRRMAEEHHVTRQYGPPVQDRRPG